MPASSRRSASSASSISRPQYPHASAVPRNLTGRSEDISSSNRPSCLKNAESAAIGARSGSPVDQKFDQGSLLGSSVQSIRVGDGTSTNPCDSSPKEGKLQLWRSFIEDHNRLMKCRIRADELRRKAGARRKKSTQQNRVVFRLLQQFSAQVIDVDGDSIQQNLNDIQQAEQTMIEEEQRMLEADGELEVQEQAIIDLEARISGSLPRIENFEAERAVRVLFENRLGLQDEESSDDSRCVSSHPSEISTSAREIRGILDKIDLIEEILAASEDGPCYVQPGTSPSTDENEYLKLGSDVLEALLKNFRIDLELCRDRGRAESPFLSENSRSMRLVNDQRRSESQRRSPLKFAYLD